MSPSIIEPSAASGGALSRLERQLALKTSEADAAAATIVILEQNLADVWICTV
jgi:hypothetical protein